ncbi:MAG: DeoR/GlpR family DNA-binding transcription regulator [Cellulosilyticaceae bacterium]
MLTEERQQLIVKMLNQRGTVTVSELVELLDASESTIRRDLTTLDEKGSLKKIHGGAMLLEKNTSHIEYRMERKQEMNKSQKEVIAKRAAELIEEGDVVYLDAGTTTELMITYIQAKDLIVVTNGIGHIKKLLERGIHTIVLGGAIKATTEAVVGAKAMEDLDKYQFTKGFFGTNGISSTKGYTTPDIEEAMVKQKAVEKSSMVYVLGDHTKIGQASFVSFAKLERATLITDGAVSQALHAQTNIIEVENDD